jgi:hypothetical protein
MKGAREPCPFLRLSEGSKKRRHEYTARLALSNLSNLCSESFLDCQFLRRPLCFDCFEMCILFS